jgi:hypothetical protein
MWETIALRLVGLESSRHRPCQSRVDLHDEDLISVHIHHEVYAVHSFEDALVVDVITESLSDGVYLASNLLLHLFILEVIISMLVPAEACTLGCQFRMPNDLRVKRTDDSPKSTCYGADPKGF